LFVVFDNLIGKFLRDMDFVFGSQRFNSCSCIDGVTEQLEPCLRIEREEKT